MENLENLDLQPGKLHTSMVSTNGRIRKETKKKKKGRKKQAVIQNVETYTDLVSNKARQKRRRRIYRKGKGLHHLHLFLLF